MSDPMEMPYEIEVGAVGPHTTEGHVNHLRDSLELAGHAGPYKMFGVFVKGDDRIVCYTGNGPDGEANAHRIVAARAEVEAAKLDLAADRKRIDSQRELIRKFRCEVEALQRERDNARALYESAEADQIEIGREPDYEAGAREFEEWAREHFKREIRWDVKGPYLVHDAARDTRDIWGQWEGWQAAASLRRVDYAAATRVYGATLYEHTQLGKGDAWAARAIVDAALGEK